MDAPEELEEEEERGEEKGDQAILTHHLHHTLGSATHCSNDGLMLKNYIYHFLD